MKVTVSLYGISHYSGNFSRHNVDNSSIKSPKLERRVLLTGGNVAMVTDYAIRITIKGSSMACLSCSIDL